MSRYRNRDGKVACFECGHEFQKQEKAVSRTRGSCQDRKRVLTCSTCAEEKGIVYSF